MIITHSIHSIKILSEAFGSFTYDAFIVKGLIRSYDALKLYICKKRIYDFYNFKRNNYGVFLYHLLQI